MLPSIDSSADVLYSCKLREILEDSIDCAALCCWCQAPPLVDLRDDEAFEAHVKHPAGNRRLHAPHLGIQGVHLARGVSGGDARRARRTLLAGRHRPRDWCLFSLPRRKGPQGHQTRGLAADSFPKASLQGVVPLSTTG